MNVMGGAASQLLIGETSGHVISHKGASTNTLVPSGTPVPTGAGSGLVISELDIPGQVITHPGESVMAEEESGMEVSQPDVPGDDIKLAGELILDSQESGMDLDNSEPVITTDQDLSVDTLIRCMGGHGTEEEMAKLGRKAGDDKPREMRLSPEPRRNRRLVRSTPPSSIGELQTGEVRELVSRQG